MESVSNSNGVHESDGVNRSDGVNESDGVHESDGVNWSDGVHESYGVNWSDGVHESYGVHWSDGVNGSNGVNGSYGVVRSFGVSQAIFCADKLRIPTIFGTEVSQQRYKEVWERIRLLNNGWFPKFNNAFELYVKNGNDWAKVDASQIKSTDESLAWKDMPKQTIDYLRSLPEFDASIFKAVTGFDSEESEAKTKARELREKADELREKADELLKQATALETSL